jgi:putative endonuclease
MYYVYFLKSLKKPNWIYTGSTGNLKRRLAEHSNGLSAYTKTYLPIKLAGYVAVNTEAGARELEKYFKTGSGIAILKKRILSDEALA